MESLPNVCMISATKGRHFHIERVLKCFLDQDYIGKSTLLIYNNSSVVQQLDNFEIPENKSVILINNCIDLKTKLPYDNLGAIYRDALTFVPEDTDIVNHSDDDDLYLPNHITEGVKGIVNSGKTAYKPKFSYYLTEDGTHVIENTLEPSIFVKFKHLQSTGYHETTSNQHYGWLLPLLPDDIFVDPNGKKTFIYTWNGGVFKTSGCNEQDIVFEKYQNFSREHGDKIITPVKNIPELNDK